MGSVLQSNSHSCVRTNTKWFLDPIETGMVMNHWKFIQARFTNQYTAHTSSRLTKEELHPWKRLNEAASPQNIIHPALSAETLRCTGNQTVLYLIHTSQTQQTDQGHGHWGVVPTMSIKWPASGNLQRHPAGGGGHYVLEQPSTLIRMAV